MARDTTHERLFATAMALQFDGRPWPEAQPWYDAAMRARQGASLAALAESTDLGTAFHGDAAAIERRASEIVDDFETREGGERLDMLVWVGDATWVRGFLALGIGSTDAVAEADPDELPPDLAQIALAVAIARRLGARGRVAGPSVRPDALPHLPPNEALEVADAWAVREGPQRLACTYGEIAALRSVCEARAVDWRWATGAVAQGELYPHARHIDREKRGKIQKDEPDESDGRDGMHELGLDEGGELVVRRTWSRYTRAYSELFVLRRDDGWLSLNLATEGAYFAIAGWKQVAVNTWRGVLAPGGDLASVERHYVNGAEDRLSFDLGSDGGTIHSTRFGTYSVAKKGRRVVVSGPSRT